MGNLRCSVVRSVWKRNWYKDAGHVMMLGGCEE